ncbi:MAG: hypothetical protein MZV65_15515 [Chromatiales bacterium]|nr:hypothetical protein [Chromatiales bacterium]
MASMSEASSPLKEDARSGGQQEEQPGPHDEDAAAEGEDFLVQPARPGPLPAVEVRLEALAGRDRGEPTPQNPHRLGLKRLRELCGSDYERLRDLRDDARKAMAQLQAAGVVTAWRITPGDALEVVRPNRKRRIIEGENPTG